MPLGLTLDDMGLYVNTRDILSSAQLSGAALGVLFSIRGTIWTTTTLAPG